MLFPPSKQVILCILDGWGLAKPSSNNAISLAAPFWETLLKRYPHTALQASEGYVGLPDGQMGNSEVGHMTIGLGRILVQDLPRINQAIQHRTLKNNPQLREFIQRLNPNQATCHLMGLLSSGGVHSHQDHLFALLEILKNEGIPVKIHAFLDGRDTPPKSAKLSLSQLEPFLNDIIQLASLTGRYYAMDRDQRWERTEQAYQTLVEGQSIYEFETAQETINYFYSQNITDEFIPPCLLKSTKGVPSVPKKGDGLLMANFRSDRVRQLLTACVDPTFDAFNRAGLIPFSAVLGMTQYSDQLDRFIPALFPRIPLEHGLGELIANQGYAQLRLAETEKYAHVTFFFNGGREAPFPREERILIPSPSVATYDQCPAMSAPALTQSALTALSQQNHKLIVMNYANADMVGHTGCLEATQQAIAVLDDSLKELEQGALANDYTLIITADHGNAEQMQDKHATPHTAHTCNPVPFVLISPHSYNLKTTGTLADIAPTVLELLGFEAPAEMTGQSLLVD